MHCACAVVAARSHARGWRTQEAVGRVPEDAPVLFEADLDAFWLRRLRTRRARVAPVDVPAPFV